MSDASALAERMGAIALDLEVMATSNPTPSVRRVRLTGPGLETMAPQPGQDVMLAVGGSARRRYSVRTYSSGGAGAPSWVDLDFVLHGDGPAVRWASSATPGTTIGVIGPRGKVLLDAEADWHLWAGDDTFLPAAFNMVEALPADGRAMIVLEVDSEEDRQEPSAVTELDGPHWLYRRGGVQGEAGLLTAALAGIDLPEGRGRAYLAGELRVVSAMRSVLIERGMDPEHISPKPYWRKGVANQDHGEPQRD